MNWKDVQKTISEGEALSFLDVGTEFNLTLKDGSTATLAVAAIDLYQKNEVRFVFRNTVGPNHVMNQDWTNLHGWKECNMRRYLNEVVIKLLPDDIASVMAYKNTTQKVGEDYFISQDKLFLPSEFEMFGSEIYADHNGIDRQFPFFEERLNRIARDESGKSVRYWLSSFTEG